MRLIVLMLLLSGVVMADDLQRWRWSAYAFAGSQAFDVATSWGQPESNPRLRGLNGRCCSSTGLVVKTAVAGMIILAQRHIIRKHPHSRAAKIFTGMNFGLAGTGAVIGIRNLRMR